MAAVEDELMIGGARNEEGEEEEEEEGREEEERGRAVSASRWGGMVASMAG